MGRFDTTKATINANIKKNGNQEITGSILNSVMTEMVDATDAQLTELEGELATLDSEIFVDSENYKDTISELYITAPLSTEGRLVVKNYNGTLYVRFGTDVIDPTTITSAWQSVSSISTAENGKVITLYCTTASSSLGVSVGDIIGYIIFKNVEKFISYNNTGAGEFVFAEKCTDINFSPIINSFLVLIGDIKQNADSIYANTNAINEITHEIFVSATQYFNTIAELYITAPSVSGEDLIVKTYDSRLYIRFGNTTGISSSTWQAQFQLTGKVNGIVYEVLCTAASENLGVNVGDLVGYIVLKDIDVLKSFDDASVGHPVYLSKCTDINFSPIILSTLQNDTPEEPTIQDRSISAIKLQNFGKLPRITTSNVSDMNSVVDEIYILPEYCDDSWQYKIRPFNRGFIFGAYQSTIRRDWGIRLYYLEETSYQNGDLIPLVVDITLSDVAVGTLVGYIILKDIDTLIQMPNDAGDGEMVDIGLASQLWLNPKIAVLVNSSNNEYVSPLISGVDITLPDEIIAVEGDTLQIFWRSVIGAFNPYIFDVVAVCSVGKSYPRYYTFTPTTSNVGNEYTLKVLVKGNDGTTIVERSVKIKVAAKITSPSSTKNILCIGASATAGGQWVGELDRRLTTTSGDGTSANPTGLGLTNISFVGRKTGTSNPVHLEATGGWRVQDYASAGSRAVRFYVTGVNTISLGARYSHNGVIYGVQEVNVTDGVGNIRCTLENTFVAPSEPYLLTKVSGSGDDEITFTSYEEENFSPFWNESTNELDFVTYANTYCDGHIDCLIWHCGVNDLTSGNPSVIPTVISSFRELLDAYHQQFPNGKVIISSVPIGSVNGGFAANYGASATLNYFKFAKVVQKYAQALDDLCNEAAYSSFVEYAPALEEFDAENSYPTTQTPVNNRSSVTEALGTNGVHPTIEGSYQVADAIYRVINTILQSEPDNPDDGKIVASAESIYIPKGLVLKSTTSPRGVISFRVTNGNTYELYIPKTGNAYAVQYAFGNSNTNGAVEEGIILTEGVGEGNEQPATHTITVGANPYLYVCYTLDGGVPTLKKL